MRHKRDSIVSESYARACDPLRAADWRWRWANEVVRDKLESPPEDASVAQAYQHLALPASARSSPEAFEHQHLAEARLIFEASDQARAELEARLLAREATAVIATKMRLEPAVIDLYASLFFDLPPAGTGEDWLLFTVLLGEDSGRCLPVEGQIWRWVGFMAGPSVLDLLVGSAAGRDGSDPHELGETLRFLFRDAVQIVESPVPPADHLAAIEQRVAAARQRHAGDAE